MSFNFTLNQKIRTLQFINFIVACWGIWYLFQTPDWLTWLLVTAVGIFFIPVVGGNVVLHRMVSHRAFKTAPWMEKVLLTISVFATIGSPLSFGAFHRYHHAHSDQIDDNHSPYIHQPDGSLKFSYWQAFKIAIGWWHQTILSPKYTIDLMRNDYIRFLHNNYFKVLLIPLAILALVNPLIVVYFYCIPMIKGLISSQFALTVITHVHGYKTYNVGDESRNSWIAWIISLGEGWHNNHHHSPGNYRQGEKWWELDPIAWIIERVKV